METLSTVLRICASHAVVARTHSQSDFTTVMMLKMMASSKTVREEVLGGEASDVFNELFGYFFNHCIALPRELERLNSCGCGLSRAGEQCAFVGADNLTHGRGCCHDYVDTVLRWIQGARNVFRCPVPGCKLASFGSMEDLHAHQFHCVRRWNCNRQVVKLSVRRQLDKAPYDLSVLGKRPRPQEWRSEFTQESDMPSKRFRCFAEMVNDFDAHTKEYMQGPYVCSHNWCVAGICKLIEDLAAHPKREAMLKIFKMVFRNFNDGATDLCGIDRGTVAVGQALSILLARIDVALRGAVPCWLPANTLSFERRSCLDRHQHQHHAICGEALVESGDTLCVAMQRSLRTCREPISRDQKRELWHRARTTLPDQATEGCQIAEYARPAADLAAAAAAVITANISLDARCGGGLATDLFFATVMQFFCPATEATATRVSYVRIVLSLSKGHPRSSAGAWRQLRQFARRLASLPCMSAATAETIEALELPPLHTLLSTAWWGTSCVLALVDHVFDMLIVYSTALRAQLLSRCTAPEALAVYANRWHDHIMSSTWNRYNLVEHLHTTIGRLQVRTATVVLLGARRVCESVVAAAVEAAVNPELVAPLVAAIDRVTEPFRCGGTLASYVAAHRAVDVLEGDVQSMCQTACSPLGGVLRSLRAWQVGLDYQFGSMDSRVAHEAVTSLFTDPAFLLLPVSASGKRLRIRTTVTLDTQPKRIGASVHLVAATTQVRKPPLVGADLALRHLIRCVQCKLGEWTELQRTAKMT